MVQTGSTTAPRIDVPPDEASKPIATAGGWQEVQLSPALSTVASALQTPSIAGSATEQSPKVVAAAASQNEAPEDTKLEKAVVDSKLQPPQAISSSPLTAVQLPSETVVEPPVEINEGDLASQLAAERQLRKEADRRAKSASAALEEAEAAAAAAAKTKVVIEEALKHAEQETVSLRLKLAGVEAKFAATTAMQTAAEAKAANAVKAQAGADVAAEIKSLRDELAASIRSREADAVATAELEHECDHLKELLAEATKNFNAEREIEKSVLVSSRFHVDFC